MNIQRSLESGEKVNLFNRCFVFEDFYVSTGAFSWRTWAHLHEDSLIQKTKMSLDALFDQPQDTLQNLYHLHGFRASWKYLEIGGGEDVFHLKDHVILGARESLKKIAPLSKRVAIHLRVTDLSKADGDFHFPGPGTQFSRKNIS